MLGWTKGVSEPGDHAVGWCCAAGGVAGRGLFCFKLATLRFSAWFLGAVLHLSVAVCWLWMWCGLVYISALLLLMGALTSLRSRPFWVAHLIQLSAGSGGLSLSCGGSCALQPAGLFTTALGSGPVGVLGPRTQLGDSRWDRSKVDVTKCSERSYGHLQCLQ